MAKHFAGTSQRAVLHVQSCTETVVAVVFVGVGFDVGLLAIFSVHGNGPDEPGLVPQVGCDCCGRRLVCGWNYRQKCLFHLLSSHFSSCAPPEQRLALPNRPIRDRGAVLTWMKLLSKELAARIRADREAWSRKATKLTLQIVSLKAGSRCDERGSPLEQQGAGHVS